MRIDLVTLFPEMFAGVCGTSIIGRATARGILEIAYTNFRDYATDKHHHVDDTPCGGGAGSFMSGPFRAQRRATTVLEAWARGRTVRESILTWAGRSRVHTMHSATSEAVNGASTPA